MLNLLADTLAGYTLATWLAAAGLDPRTTVKVVLDTENFCVAGDWACVSETLTGWSCPDFIAGCFTVYITHEHIAAKRSLAESFAHELGHIKYDRFHINKWPSLSAKERAEREERAWKFSKEVLHRLGRTYHH